jgi:large subunit ribosomal protein L24
MARTIQEGSGKGAFARHKLHVRRGDRVKVIRGNDAGKTGTVMRVLTKENRVVVEGVNMRKRATRATQDREGGIITREEPIHASNVMLIDPATGEPTRSKMKTNNDGTRSRVAAKSGNPLPSATPTGKK